ncbi:metallophosphoesterase [Mesorhizobium sp.]|uniref:metallophosphoesterase family protein n=1 Tax=Mesorhizobium sp. TaxID=1871066 RepID=UPI001207E04A|nr:metallophosphoesterase [Mesorhizobium sp.]TIL43300.1 MAG: hypothetical protein E5Y86_22945 [Mesorhizobium sp.]
MAERLQSETAVPVVTLRSLEGAKNMGSGLEAAFDPETKKVVDRYNSALEKLGEETAKTSADVLITVPDRDASMLQSRMAEDAEVGRPLPSGGLEAQFGEGLTGGDIWGWAKSVFDHVREDNWHSIVRPPDDKVGAIADKGRVAALADWGTNLYGAPASAASIKKAGGYELLLHLGDIYYSGTKKESKKRFIDAWPTGAGKVSRALNGNHEMYSGGFAYFDDILPHFSQPSSYFALQNANWLLVGLDTAHTDNHDIDEQQLAWLKSVMQKKGQRKAILFSHHQPFSRLDKQGPGLQAALAGLFQQQAITAWYWGHEHDCIIYDRHAQSGMLGRCIGNGGIPSPRKSIVRNAPTERPLDAVAWKRLSQNEDAPACLVLDGENPLVKGDEKKFGPHGYLTLEFDGPNLTERIHLPDGTEIFAGPVT